MAKSEVIAVVVKLSSGVKVKITPSGFTAVDQRGIYQEEQAEIDKIRRDLNHALGWWG